MRQLVAIPLLCALVGCASTGTGTPSMRQQCEERYDRVWIAAQSALSALGAVTVNANRSWGTIQGRIDAEVYGAEIELGITVRRTPDTRVDSVEPLWVEVRTWDPSTTDPDAYRMEKLEMVARQYLELVGQRANCGPPM
jgi:hypothetical protein